MGAPSVSVSFIEQAKASISRGDRGVIAMLLVDSEEATYTITAVTDIPTGLTTFNQTQLKLALLGNDTAPKKIYVLVQTEADYSAALEYFGTMTWNYFVSPTVATDAATDTVASWIKTQRDTYKLTYKAVLPETAADHEGIVNVVGSCTYDEDELTAEQLCGRVAGIICGTKLSASGTYAALPEMSDCERMTSAELDEAVEDGQLVFMWDGEKVKICRAVNSLTTTTDEKGDSFKKIKLVDAMDMIKDDIRLTAQDTYIGKFANTYDNKCLLITAINNYFDTLVKESVLESGECEIDIEANRDYISEKGGEFILNGETIDLEDATDEEVKKANTGSYVFLTASISLIDAIEDIELEIYIG